MKQQMIWYPVGVYDAVQVRANSARDKKKGPEGPFSDFEKSYCALVSEADPLEGVNPFSVAIFSCSRKRRT